VTVDAQIMQPQYVNAVTESGESFAALNSVCSHFQDNGRHWNSPDHSSGRKGQGESPFFIVTMRPSTDPTN
jgi:hypothetical protein